MGRPRTEVPVPSHKVSVGRIASGKFMSYGSLPWDGVSDLTFPESTSETSVSYVQITQRKILPIATRPLRKGEKFFLRSPAIPAPPAAISEADIAAVIGQEFFDRLIKESVEAEMISQELGSRRLLRAAKAAVKVYFELSAERTEEKEEECHRP